MNTWHYAQAARVLKSGGVIAYPTEAVWGLGCDPYNIDAVKKLLLLKRRPMAKGVILVAADMEQVAPLLAGLTDEQLAQLKASWPGPSTWLIPDPDNLIPSWIKGEHSRVAIRVSNHLQVRLLCSAFGGMLVSTSANVGGAAPARSLLRVNTYFGSSLDYRLPGKLGGAASPTAIRDLCTGDTVRA